MKRFVVLISLGFNLFVGVVEVQLGMKLMLPFLPAYSDALSSDFKELENGFTNSVRLKPMNTPSNALFPM